MNDRLPTSVMLGSLLRDAPAETVTVAWVLDSLHERSFGLVMLILGLLALVPGLSTFVGLLAAWPATQMILGRRAPSLPRWMASRQLPTRRFERLIARALPALRWLERMIRPRWRTPSILTKRVVGVAILLLGITLAAPVPLSHIVPALSIVLLAVAFLEEDGLLLSIALVIAMASLGITVVAVWGAMVGLEELTE